MDHFFDHTGCVYGVMDYFNQPSCKVKYFIVPEVHDDVVIDFGEYNNKIPGSRQLLSNRVPSDEPVQGQHTYFSNLPGIDSEPQNIHQQQFGEGLSIYTMPPLQIPEKQGGRKQRKRKTKTKAKAKTKLKRKTYKKKKLNNKKKHHSKNKKREKSTNKRRKNKKSKNIL
jgi:hypothetical protein